MHLPRPMEPILHQWWFSKKRLLLIVPFWTYTNTHTQPEKTAISYTDNCDVSWATHFQEPIWHLCIQGYTLVMEMCVCVWVFVSAYYGSAHFCKWNVFGVFSDHVFLHVLAHLLQLECLNCHSLPQRAVVWLFFLPCRQPMILIYFAVWCKTNCRHLKHAKGRSTITVNSMSVFPDLSQLLLLLPGNAVQTFLKSALYYCSWLKKRRFDAHCIHRKNGNYWLPGQRTYLK